VGWLEGDGRFRGGGRSGCDYLGCGCMIERRVKRGVYAGLGGDGPIIHLLGIFWAGDLGWYLVTVPI